MNMRLPNEQGLKSFLTSLGCLARVIWLCGYAATFVTAAFLFFVVSSQGADFLRLLSEPTPSSFDRWPRSAFFVGVVLWSLASWYASRLLAIRELPGFRLPAGPSEAYRIWVPRVLGGLAPLVVAVGFARVGFSGAAGALSGVLLWQALCFAVLAAVLFAFYWNRRNLFPDLTFRQSAGVYLPVLPGQSVRLVSAAIVLSFVLLLLFVAFPVAGPRFFGAPAIFVLAATAWVLFGSIVLMFIPLARGYTGMTLPVVVFAVLISALNDNHHVREAAPVPGQLSAADRDTAHDHFRRWLATVESEAPLPEKRSSAPTCGGETGKLDTVASGDRYPVFVVAAAGGGIRAAYWTAVVLGTAADCTGSETWRRHLYAVSGVSGGSLGAIVHAAEVVEATPGGSANMAELARAVLADDHLSPVAAFLLFPDLFQRFLPHPIAAFDRARALELSWEDSARTSLGSSILSRPFLALWMKPRRYALPALLLNSTRVETGQRAVLSNLDLTQGFPDVIDPLATELGATPGDTYRLARLANAPVSTAAHLSARFTYVSPAARVEREPAGGLWGRLVDGGYFDNSGAATATDLLNEIVSEDAAATGAAAASPQKKPIFISVIIKNDPHAPSAFANSVREPLRPPSNFLSEITAPVNALLAARDARGMLAEEDFIASVQAANADPTLARDTCVLQFTLAPPEPTTLQKAIAERKARFEDPPLGWSLSKLSIESIEERLVEQADQFRRIRESIRLGRCVGSSTGS